MESLCLLTSFTGTKGCSLVSGPLIYIRSCRSRGKFSVYARIKKGRRRHEYPWPDDIDPNLKSGHLSYLSSFKPLTEKPKHVVLEFEKPLVELEAKITAVRKMAVDTGLDLSTEIGSLEKKYQEELKHLYTHLTPYQRLCISRHPNRPTFLDHVLNITEKWVELHGDRAGYDDPAIVTGLGSIDGKTYMLIGHQKGRNTKENIYRNFGMPTPHGYRKALRMMRYADHHGFPIITFVDTPGAFADLKSEELGQGEAIAQNLRTMFGLKVPVVSVVIGEGGSGGALAIACPNKMLMLENAVFYVARIIRWDDCFVENLHFTIVNHKKQVVSLEICWVGQPLWINCIVYASKVHVIQWEAWQLIELSSSRVTLDFVGDVNITMS